MNLKEETRSQIIKGIAAELGFFSCGISKAQFLEEDAPRLEQWLKANMHGEMAYMENHFDKRLDPRLLVPGCKTVVSLLINYFPSKRQREDAYRISTYAYGEDYHDVIREKLKRFMALLEERIGAVEGRYFVDSAPVMDKSWAAKSGLGWRGKNGNLIHPKKGSFFFIAELLIDLECAPDQAIRDYCGTCTRCIDACPTGALDTPYVVDGSKCISYVTIELKGDHVPDAFQGKMENWMFGCDICQDVCPWNRFSQPHNEKAFEPLPEILSFASEDWEALTEENFKELFRRSPLKRSKYTGFMRNISALKR